MTPHDLRARLAAIDPDGSLPPLEEPARLLAALEERADRAPADQRVAAAIRGVHAVLSAAVELPPIVGGVRREGLVRWDDWTTTWDGVGAVSGRSCRVRVLRPAFSKDPVPRRSLLRDGRALRAAGWHIEALDADLPALVAPIDGPPLHPHPVGASPDDDPARLVRLFASAIQGLERLQSAGVGLVDLDPGEIRLGPSGVQYVCLTPGDPVDAGRALSRVCRSLTAYWNDGPMSPIDALLAGFSRFPPRDLVEAREALTAAVAQWLAGYRHSLRKRADRVHRADRRGRLYRAVVALDRALPSPRGRGAVGVDLDGNTTILAGDGRALTWGKADAPETAWSDDKGVVPAVVRRLLRARAAAPSNPRLQQDVGGDPAFVDAACRWLSAALANRTTRLLLEAEPA